MPKLISSPMTAKELIQSLQKLGNLDRDVIFSDGYTYSYVNSAKSEDNKTITLSFR